MKGPPLWIGIVSSAWCFLVCLIGSLLVVEEKTSIAVGIISGGLLTIWGIALLPRKK